jgi:uncharacterized protein YxeA
MKQILYLLLPIVLVVVLAYLVFKKINGFQNQTDRSNDTINIKEQICSILNSTLNSMKMSYEKMDKSNETLSSTMRIHIEGIKQQLKENSC